MIRLQWIIFLFLGTLMSLGAQALVFPDNLIYNDFYTISVHQSDGETFNLFDAAYFDGDIPPWPNAEGDFGNFPASNPGNDLKYFFWIRRSGELGDITYPLSFRRIAEIHFVGDFGGNVENLPRKGILSLDDVKRPVMVIETGSRFRGWFEPSRPSIPGFTQAILKLTDGSEAEVFVKTDGFLGGIDESFGTYAMLIMEYGTIEKLIFNHNGTYARCPECGAIFYNDRSDICPFDGTELIPARER